MMFTMQHFIGARSLSYAAKQKITGNFTEMDGLYYLPVIKNQQGKTELALSVGGDNYCYGNTAIYEYLNKEYRKAGIKTVLWGCSIEPDVVAEPAVSNDCAATL